MPQRYRPRHRPSEKFKKTLLGGGALVVLAALNAPAALTFAEERYHAYKIAQPGYKRQYGSWEILDVPKEFRTNAIHAALLHTGKVLIIAGSGNNQKKFDEGSFDTILWNPADNSFKKIPTPEDFFCSGHSQLPDGRLLVAGGTARYEVLDGEVKRAGGRMRVKNENPDRAHTFKKGTRFRSPSGVEFISKFDVTVPRAKKELKVGYGQGGRMLPWRTKVTAGEARVFVEAAETGPRGLTTQAAQYEIVGLTGKDADDLYGLAQKLTTEKQDFQGIRSAYEFDPRAEKYIPVDPMKEARWYPTLVTLDDGKVLAVSGLDDVGAVLTGDNELYDPETKEWSKGPTRYFPTYPALFLTKGGKLFYSGSNAGYGPAEKGRRPGIWDLTKNTFTEVGGLTDPDQTETSASLMLPPAQDQRVMLLGGGGVGESSKATSRTAIVDLTQDSPAFQEGPRLPKGTRYLSSVLLPDDTVFTTGGSSDYRGRSASDILKAQFYEPRTSTFRPAADPTVGRNYHSEALLLPDGRVVTFGSDPLFRDADNTKLGTFEQRVEIYTPPYLQGDRVGENRPTLGEGPQEVDRTGRATFRAARPDRIAKARLMRPSAVTHTTDVEQRSIELALTKTKDAVTVEVPKDRALVPPGWYMLFVTDSAGVPSEAKWIRVE
ncbi:kelch motif-containing protein [Streptomyces scopuliridis]|uniref:Kelch motif-containing protein n=1 Tax=Streptomyces scopuliridis TaxID=452529 RepID=A0ACD4ZIL2_9ACTN|nr:kelch motif-containing protein [Streptomyces scopuliridis]WSB33359.1 kelch motif-containing protein [Streptomyces scopuliridis]WSB97627.1 kelch motif-containing protein [Streptomyces scopuliridis]WSC08670.1 kelch motif-containing protein [Streptomyces scopuliridis]